MRRATALAALAFALPAAAQAPQIQSAAEALRQDAGEYAAHFGVSPDTALLRLQAQQASAGLAERLAERFPDRLAGVSVEHLPDYRLVVLLTGSDPVPDERIFAGGMLVPVVFRTGAPANRLQLLTAVAEHQAAIRALLPHPPAMGIDARTGTLVVYVSAGDAERFAPGELRTRIADLTGVPVRIAAVDRPGEELAGVGQGEAGGAAIAGGARVVGSANGGRYSCTTGYVVTDGSRTGIATAAHCPDTLRYAGGGAGVELPFAGQWGWGFQDVQLNLSPFPSGPLFFADSARTTLRPVEAVRARAATRAGDWVCHRGERTGYSCAEVELVDFAPAGDLCGGACLASWVTVRGPVCKSGDSGGPVFAGTTALGILKGGSYRRDGSCAFYYYMALDYLPQGWSVLRAPAASPVPDMN